MLLLYNEINDVITEGFCLIVTVVQSVKWAFEYTSWEMGKKKKHFSNLSSDYTLVSCLQIPSMLTSTKEFRRQNQSFSILPTLPEVFPYF